MGTLEGAQVLSPESAREMTGQQLDTEFIGEQMAILGRPAGTAGFGFCGMSGSEFIEGSRTPITDYYWWGGWASTKFWIDRRNDMFVVIFTQILPVGVKGMNLEDPVRKIIRDVLSAEVQRDYEHYSLKVSE